MQLRFTLCIIVNEATFWTCERANDKNFYNMERRLFQSIGTILGLYLGDIALDYNRDL